MPRTHYQGRGPAGHGTEFFDCRARFFKRGVATSLRSLLLFNVDVGKEAAQLQSVRGFLAGVVLESCEREVDVTPAATLKLLGLIPEFFDRRDMLGLGSRFLLKKAIEAGAFGWQDLAKKRGG